MADRIQLGDSGPDVLSLQQAINTVWAAEVQARGSPDCEWNRGAVARPERPVPEDGQYGPDTEQMVRWLQCVLLAWNSPDGVADREFLARLRAYLQSLTELTRLGDLTFGDPGLSPVRFTVSCLGNRVRVAAGLPALPTPEPCEGIEPPGGERPQPWYAKVGAWIGMAAASLAGYGLWRLVRGRQ